MIPTSVSPDGKTLLFANRTDQKPFAVPSLSPVAGIFDVEDTESSIAVVTSQLGTFVRIGSRIHRHWEDVRQLVTTLFEPGHSALSRRNVLELAQILFQSLQGMVQANAEPAWGELAEAFHEEAGKLRITLPKDLPVVGDEQSFSPRRKAVWN
jgi:hypothetical protein